MKILIVTEIYLPAVNGVIISANNLAKGLAKMGHDVKILTLGKKTEKKDNVYYISSIDISKIYKDVRFTLETTNRLTRELVRWKPDIVHTNTEGSVYLVANDIVRRTKAIHVHTYHTNYLGYYTDYLKINKKLVTSAIKETVYHLFKKLDAIVSPSEWGKKLVSEYKIFCPVYVIANGINTQRFILPDDSARKRIREQYGIGEDECLYIFLGRVAHEKNIEELLCFFAREEMKDKRIMVVGLGPNSEHLENMAKNLNIQDRVIFTGGVPNDKTPEYYSAGDVFLTASLSEVQPLTYVEAMSSALPAICRKAPFVDGLIENGKNGYTYESYEEFLECINKLDKDSELRAEIGKNARETVLYPYSIEAFADNMNNLYLQLLKEKRGIDG